MLRLTTYKAAHKNTRVTCSTLRAISQTTTTAENTAPQKTFREKARDTWNGPTFKYWFVGGTGFLCWLSYYSWKAYKNKCIDVELLPPLPSYPLMERKLEINGLLEKLKGQQSIIGGNNIKKLVVQGPSASGKTILVNQFVQELKRLRSSKFGLPKSAVTLFLHADSESSFLISLKSAAAKLDIQLSELDETMSNGSFNQGSFTEQCEALLINIQDKLLKHPGWILTFDQLLSTSPKTILNVINNCLQDDESWSPGLMILVADGINLKEMAVDNDTVLTVKGFVFIF